MIPSSTSHFCIYTFEAPLLSFQSSVRSAKIFFHRTEGSMLISVSAQFSSNSRFYNCFVLISVYFFFVYVILLKKRGKSNVVLYSVQYVPCTVRSLQYVPCTVLRITLLTPPVHCICIRPRSYGSHDISMFAHLSKYR